MKWDIYSEETIQIFYEVPYEVFQIVIIALSIQWVQLYRVIGYPGDPSKIMNSKWYVAVFLVITASILSATVFQSICVFQEDESMPDSAVYKTY